MQAYVKIYFDAFGYDTEDPTIFIKSEISGDKAVDIHHIIGRGRGGTNRIENMIALTRIEHQDYGDINDFIPLLLKIHRRQLQIAGIDFDNKFFEFYIKKYE